MRTPKLGSAEALPPWERNVADPQKRAPPPYVTLPNMVVLH